MRKSIGSKRSLAMRFLMSSCHTWPPRNLAQQESGHNFPPHYCRSSFLGAMLTFAVICSVGKDIVLGDLLLLLDA
eukprot:3421612-Pyramimonas_sp.AAC.1